MIEIRRIEDGKVRECLGFTDDDMDSYIRAFQAWLVLMTYLPETVREYIRTADDIAEDEERLIQ